MAFFCSWCRESDWAQCELCRGLFLTNGVQGYCTIFYNAGGGGRGSKCHFQQTRQSWRKQGHPTMKNTVKLQYSVVHWMDFQLTMFCIVYIWVWLHCKLRDSCNFYLKTWLLSFNFFLLCAFQTFRFIWFWCSDHFVDFSCTHNSLCFEVDLFLSFLKLIFAWCTHTYDLFIAQYAFLFKFSFW